MKIAKLLPALTDVTRPQPALLAAERCAFAHYTDKQMGNYFNAINPYHLPPEILVVMMMWRTGKPESCYMDMTNEQLRKAFLKARDAVAA